MLPAAAGSATINLGAWNHSSYLAVASILIPCLSRQARMMSSSVVAKQGQICCKIASSLKMRPYNLLNWSLPACWRNVPLLKPRCNESAQSASRAPASAYRRGFGPPWLVVVLDNYAVGYRIGHVERLQARRVVEQETFEAGEGD
jgi:hypothetical protein